MSDVELIMVFLARTFPRKLLQKTLSHWHRILAGSSPQENAPPVVTNLSKGRSDEKLRELVGERQDQIRCHTRLTDEKTQ